MRSWKSFSITACHVLIGVLLPIIFFTVHTAAYGVNEQLWLEVVQPDDVAYSYKIRPAKDFGDVQSWAFRNIRLVATDPPEACGQLINNGQLIRHHVALIVRGGCSFVTKSLNAELYGAVAAVISDNEVDEQAGDVWVDMIGDGTNREGLVGIPVYYMRARDGLKIRESLKKNKLSAAVINVPVNYTNTGIPLSQPPWNPW